MELSPIVAGLEGLVERPWVVTIAGVALLLALIWAAAWMAARRRTQDIVAALENSTRGSLRLARPLRTGRLQANVVPPPEPFRIFTVEFTINGRGPLRTLMWPLTLRRQRLAFGGTLTTRPSAEIVWEKGEPPDRALGRRPETALWVARQLDFLREEYAVHGANTAAVEHAFADMQRRFGPFTRRILILRDGSPHLAMTLAANRLNAEEIASLVTTVRALARAALRE